MIKKIISQIRLPLFSIALLFSFICLSASMAKAQSYGLTGFDYSVQSGVVVGTHETYLDYNDAQYYYASVDGWLLNYGNDETLQTYQQVDYQGINAYYDAYVQTYGSVQRGKIYATYSVHYVIARYTYYQYFQDPDGFSNEYTNSGQPTYNFSYGNPALTVYQRIPVAATGIFVWLPNITGLSLSTANTGATREVEIFGKYIGEHSNINPLVSISGSGVTANVIRIVPSEGVVLNVTVADNAAPGERQLSLQSGTAPSRVPSNSVPFTITNNPPNLTSIDVTSALPGTSVATSLRGQNLFGQTQSISVSGNGVTATIRGNQQPNAIEILDINLEIAENADVGDHNITLTVGGRTSNAIVFRVGDHSPTITGISRQEGEMGEVLGITITGQYFGLNPLVQFDGTGILATIQNSSSNQIVVTFAIGDNTYEGDRGVKVKSFGISGTGFQTVPGNSDTSNSVRFTVNPLSLSPQIPPIQAVAKNDVIQPFVLITPVTNTRDVQLKLTTVTGTGQAIFTQTGNDTLTIQHTQAVEIKGLIESSEVNNIKIEASYNGRVLHSRVFTVVTIDSLVYEKINNDIPNDLNLTANPGTGNPATAIGLRIFPDKEDPVTDTRTRNAVLIKATVKPVIANLQVYFANFDPDDPSSDTAPLDPNGAAGDDNNGELLLNGTVRSKAGFLVNPDGVSTCITPGSGSTGRDIARANCPTGADGVAKVKFIVGLQPGDNYAVAASVGQIYRDGIVLNPTDGTKLNDDVGRIIPISGQPSSGDATASGIRTDFLTVWRRLHIEYDRMSPVTNTNHVTSTFPQGGTAVPRFGLAEIPVATALAPLVPGRFQRGRIEFEGISYEIADSTETSVIVKTRRPLQITQGTKFTLYDDDDYNSNQTTLTLHGDEGEAITEQPEIFRHLAPASGFYSDGTPLNILASAYVLPEYEWARNIHQYDNDNTTFKLNIESSETDTQEAENVINEHRDSASLERDNFWIAYFVLGYQGQLRASGDGFTRIPNSNQVQPDPFTEGITVQQQTASRIPCDCLNNPICPSQHVTCLLAPIGAKGSIIFEETVRDSVNTHLNFVPFPTNTRSWEIVAPHELGHQFGFRGDREDTVFNLMDYPDYAHGAPAPIIEYNPEHINIIRHRIKSPGEI